MKDFPRTMVGGLSVSRLVIGTNWFLGYSHSTVAKDNFIKAYQTRSHITSVLEVFLRAGVDTLFGLPNQLLREAIEDAENRVSRKLILISAPIFNILPGGPPLSEPEPVLDECQRLGVSICMPHQCVTDRLADKMHGVIRDLPRYSSLIRDRGMIPGLSTHMPETVVLADRTGADVETYTQIYNSDGFLMQVEADWCMRVITEARRPVIVIKPLAAGRLLPVVGLTFVWNTIRDCDMVAVGTTTPDEAREVIDTSSGILEGRIHTGDLQFTRSKSVLREAINERIAIY